MAKYTSGRQRNLKVGISSYSENTQVVSVIGRVGIGSTVFNADYDLDVRGTAKFSGNVILGNSSSNLINVPGRISSNFYPDGDGTYDVGRGPQIGSGANRWKDANFLGKGTFDGGVDAHNLELGVSSANLIYSTSGNLELNSQSGITNIDDIVTISGNLGIGTVNPQQKLWVEGNGYFSGILTAQRIISSLYGEFFGGSISGTSIVGTALSISGISTFTNGPVLIGGNLGIGTTNPQAKFHSYGIDATLSTVLGAPTNTLIEVEDGNPWSIAFRRTDLGPTADVAAGWIDDYRNFIIASGLPNGGFNYSVGINTEYVKLYAYDQERFSTLGVGATVIGTLFANQLSVSGITTVGFLTATNISVSGVVTATRFVGNLTGTATTATNLADAANITTGTINKDRITTTNALTVLGDLYVSNNISFGGTTTQLNLQQLQIVDADIVLGIGTSFTPTDNTANHGGIAIASTEGTPLVNLNIVPGETNPATYKKIMWFKGSTIGAGLTDAWLFNYGVGIGSTQVPNGVRLAAGGMQVTDTTISTPNLNVSGSVGIGTTNPGSKLTVVGDASISGLTTTNNLYVAGVGTFLSSGLKIVGASTSFQYSIAGDAIGADYTLTLPVVTSNTAIAVTGLSQTFSASQTFASGVTVSSGSFTFGSVLSSFTVSSQTTGVMTLGGPSQTGAITVGQATTSQTLNLATGVSGVGTTKTINFGTGGASGSFTQINIGPTAGVGTVVINSGTNLLVGTTTATGTASQNLQVTGGAYVSGNLGIGTTNPGEKLQVDGNMRLGVSTTSNYIAFYGTTGDGPGSYNHTYIGERIWSTGTERSELLLFKGNDIDVANGWDRIRLAASQVRIDTYTTVTSGTFEGVGTSTNLVNRVVVHSTGEVGIGTDVLTGTASQRLQVTGGAYVSGSVGIGTTNPKATLQVKDALAFETTNTTTSSTSQVAVDTFATATFRSAKYQVQITCPGQLATLGGITTGGSGYTAGTFNVTFSNSSGTGAAAQGTLTISNGTVSQIGLGTTGGSGYIAGDVLTAGGGSGFQVSVGSTDASGSILTLGSITSSGIGYTAGVGVGTTTLTFLGGTGTGAVGLATIFDGVITSATLLQQPTTGTGGTTYYSGSNYTTSTVLTIAKSDVTNTITGISTDVGISTFTSLTAHGIGVSDVIRVSSTSNGLTAGTDYYVVTVPDTTSFTLGSSVGIGTTFVYGTSLSIGFYRNSANAGGSVAYLNAITGVSTNYQVSDLLVLQNGTTADYVEYAGIANNDILGTFAADISGANARLLLTPTYATNTVKVARQVMTV
jgi:hypothetical protein